MSTTPRDSHDDDAPELGGTPAPETPVPETTAPATTAPAAPAPEATAGETAPAGTDPPAAGPAPSTLDAPSGAHASPRPYPPSVPERRSVTAPADPLTDATWTPPAPSAPATPVTPAVAQTPPTAPDDPGVTRPLPTMPADTQVTPPAPSPGTPPVAAAPSTTAPVPDAPAAAPASATPEAPPTGAASLLGPDQRSRRDIPDPPARPGFVRHLLGVVLGLVVTPVALLLVGVGLARLADIAGTARMGTDVLGLSLLVVGVVLLAAVVLLGAWTPALPITGGLVWGIGLGAAYLALPNRTNRTIEQVFGEVPAPADQLAQTAMSGYLVLVGTLLLAAGIAIGVARRLGRRYAEQVAAVERAEAEQRLEHERAAERARAAQAAHDSRATQA